MYRSSIRGREGEIKKKGETEGERNIGPSSKACKLMIGEERVGERNRKDER